MNRRELRLAVERRLGVSTPNSDPKLGPDVIHEALNLALSSIAADRQLEWLLTSTAGTIASGTGSMTLPADCIDVKDLTVLQTDGSTYLRAKQAPFEDVVPAKTGAEPRWCRFGNTIQVTPLPTSSLTVRLYYWRNEPTLDADDQVPLMPTQFHPAVVALAARDMAVRKSDTRLMTNLMGLANAELGKLDKRPGTSGKRSVRMVAYDVTELEQFAAWS